MKKWVLVLAVFLVGCASAAQHRAGVTDDAKGNLTLGKVQREIRVGMPSSEVVEILGSPNVVSTDEERREVWVYDKISTVTAYSTNQNGINLLILGSAASSGAVATNQKTLTIIIKYDKDGKVRDFAYHNSSF